MVDKWSISVERQWQRKTTGTRTKACPSTNLPGIETGPPQWEGARRTVRAMQRPQCTNNPDCYLFKIKHRSWARFNLIRLVSPKKTMPRVLSACKLKKQLGDSATPARLAFYVTPSPLAWSERVRQWTLHSDSDYFPKNSIKGFVC